MSTALSPYIILSIIFLHFVMLMVIAYFTSKDSGNQSFFVANKKAPWGLVAYGMIGASISGVTFLSIPGAVGAGGVNQSFSYMQMVMGYMLGYAVVALVLMPLYYRLNLISIYTYLEHRYGISAYKTGAAFFLLSRSVGTAFRMFLMALVLHKFVLEGFGIPFWLTAFIVPFLIWIYTFKGGTQTVLWTDSIQTTVFLLAVVFTIFDIAHKLDTDFFGLIEKVYNSHYSQMFFFKDGWSDPNNFFKMFISGALITMTMTGLDQDLMQKNLSCKNIGDAQKNMFTFSFTLIFVNLLFITLGASLYIFANHTGLELPNKSDQLFPYMAFNHLSPYVGILCMLGLVASSYASADSALTSLTTSFCVDFLNFQKRSKLAEEYHQEAEMNTRLEKERFRVHLGATVAIAILIILFSAIGNEAVINQLFKAAGYTYGPLLGLFAFGILTEYKIKDKFVPYICLLAPVLSFIIDKNSQSWFGGLSISFLILLVNGLITMFGLWLIREKES